MLVFYIMFLFGKKTKKLIQSAFVVLGILIIISMIILYFPALYQ